ncbi:MAG: hypothetical protein IME93_05695 [Proteobacteria bacterium]|nr:hypothetical protein [Pseudomonadota bacterium]
MLITGATLITEKSVIKRSVLLLFVAAIIGCIVPVSSSTADSGRDDRYYDDNHDRGNHRGHNKKRSRSKHRHEHSHTYSHSHPHGRGHDGRDHGHRHYSERDSRYDDRGGQYDSDRTSSPNPPRGSVTVRPPKPPKPPTPWQIARSVKPVYFSAMDKRYIKRYYRKTSRKLKLLGPSAFPPGTEGRIKRGVLLPLGIGIKSMRSKLKRKLSPLPSGYRYGLLGRVAIIYNKRTRVITDYKKIKI